MGGGSGGGGRKGRSGGGGGSGGGGIDMKSTPETMPLQIRIDQMQSIQNALVKNDRQMSSVVADQAAGKISDSDARSMKKALRAEAKTLHARHTQIKSSTQVTLKKTDSGVRRIMVSAKNPKKYGNIDLGKY